MSDLYKQTGAAASFSRFGTCLCRGSVCGLTGNSEWVACVTSWNTSFSCTGHWPKLSMQAVILIDQGGSGNSLKGKLQRHQSRQVRAESERNLELLSYCRYSRWSHFIISVMSYSVYLLSFIWWKHTGVSITLLVDNIYVIHVSQINLRQERAA